MTEQKIFEMDEEIVCVKCGKPIESFWVSDVYEKEDCRHYDIDFKCESCGEYNFETANSENDIFDKIAISMFHTCKEKRVLQCGSCHANLLISPPCKQSEQHILTGLGCPFKTNKK